MKFLAAFFIFIQFIVPRSEASELKKTFDGGNARCQLEADVGNSAYRLRLVDEKRSRSGLELTFDVMFLKCAETSSGLGLVNAKGNEVLFYRTLLSDGGIGKVEHKMLSFSLTAFSESGILFDKVLITDLSQSKARVKLEIDTSHLEKGEAVLINGLGLESAKMSGDSEDKAIIREFISGTYSLHLN